MKSIPSELRESNKKEYAAAAGAGRPVFSPLDLPASRLRPALPRWACLPGLARSCFTPAFVLLRNRIPRQILSRVPPTKEKSKRCRPRSSLHRLFSSTSFLYYDAPPSQFCRALPVSRFVRSRTRRGRPARFSTLLDRAHRRDSPPERSSETSSDVDPWRTDGNDRPFGYRSDFS